VKYFLSHGAREFELELQSGEAESFEVRLADGRVLQATFHPVDGCQYALLVDGRAYAVSIEDDASEQRALRVSIAGESFRILAADERERAADALSSGGKPRPEVLKAAMPGILVSVAVVAGDVVEAGQAVAVLEAMKMQNEVVCKHGGVVEEVLVAAGATVDGGQPLIRLAPPESEA
jgi:biotin carboxyl carrier protein